MMGPRMSGRSTAGNMPINAAGQMRNLRNWNRKGATVGCERRSQQGETRKNGILQGEKHIGLLVGLLAFRPTSESNS